MGKNRMEKLSEKLKNKKFRQPIGNQVATEWKEMGKELTAYFGKNCYWLPWRYEKWRLYEKFKAIKTEGKKDLAYFIGMLKSKP